MDSHRSRGTVVVDEEFETVDFMEFLGEDLAIALRNVKSYLENDAILSKKVLLEIWQLIFYIEDCLRNPTASLETPKQFNEDLYALLEASYMATLSLLTFENRFDFKNAEQKEQKHAHVN